MHIETPSARLSLQPGQLAHLDLAPRATLRGLAGHAWITFDHDSRDIVLGPGDEFVVETPVHALACALRGPDATELSVTA